VFISNGRGIVKNIRVTTVGGVLRAGEEIMQIVPVGDELIVEAKVSPTDIARVHAGLPANIRLDPFDYTIHGSVAGQVVYVSADTLKKETGRGEEIHYRVHVKPASNPVLSSTGKTLEILPGMTAQIDIRTGERTLMEYLLKPIRKTLTQSMGER
jgi:adhesin transport system membrane fusion protein